ncbi:hypothetical protein BGZ76_011233 [Entomortierella beljakovae]|nr:hypothetical protein BGZ76_011233 [Entomortierella beljakovae]
MYESFKIIVAGWLLLAHFYLSKPSEDFVEESYRLQGHHNTTIIYDDDNNHAIARSNSREYESLTKRRRPQAPVPQQESHRSLSQSKEIKSSTGPAIDLDFGRFKRDLERRQSSRSINSGNDQVPASPLVSGRQRVDSMDRVSPSELANPFKTPAYPSFITKKSASEYSRPSSRMSVRAHTPQLGREQSTTQAYEFGSESGNRKRSLASMSSDPRSSIKPISRQNSSRTLTGSDTRRRDVEQKSRPIVNTTKPETSASRMTKKLRQIAEDEHLEIRDKSDPGHTTTTTNTTHAVTESIPQSNVHKNQEQPTKPFSKPKPPGKNRATIIPQPSLPNKTKIPSIQEQESRRVETKKLAKLPSTGGHAEPETGLVSASLESRMNHVRDWLKEKKPPMISPPLSARSDDLREPRLPYKRKAYRQLAPATGPNKRLAMDEEHDGRIYSQGSNVPSTSQSQPTRTQTQPPLYNREKISRSRSKTEIDPLRDQPESDPFLPPINWSKFQKPHTKPVSRSSSSLGAPNNGNNPPSSQFTFRKTPLKESSSFNFENLGTLGEGSSSLSPLVKLRQSQLRLHQQEDYLGVSRREEEEDLIFNQALETWEREDDETLARNAAREAAEAEARGQKISFSLNSAVSSSSQQNSDSDEIGRGGSDSNNNRDTTATASASASLLRAVPFNGESSRRPIPEFVPRKSVSDVTHKRTVTDLSAQIPVLSKSRSSPLDQISSYSKSINADNDNTNVRPIRGPASLAKRSSYLSSAKEEYIAARRQKHPGLFTPSKKKSIADGLSFIGHDPQPQSPHTPTTMSRYIQMSNLSDEGESYE